MLSERRVIHMTRMEMRRQKEQAELVPFLNVDRKDYLSFHNMIGFIEGTVFYGVLALTMAAGVLTARAEQMNRELLIVLALACLIGYIVFIFFYRSWYFRRSLRDYREARQKISQMKRDWDILAEIYQDEKEATKPTVDLDLLFPGGSLGENE